MVAMIAAAGATGAMESRRLDARDVSASQNILMAHIVVWVSVLVPGLFISLRINAKQTRNVRFWFDDHFIILAWVSEHNQHLAWPEVPMGLVADPMSHSAGYAPILRYHLVSGTRPRTRNRFRPTRRGRTNGNQNAGHRFCYNGNRGCDLEQDVVYSRSSAGQDSRSRPTPKGVVFHLLFDIRSVGCVCLGDVVTVHPDIQSVG